MPAASRTPRQGAGSSLRPTGDAQSPWETRPRLWPSTSDRTRTSPWRRAISLSRVGEARAEGIDDAGGAAVEHVENEGLLDRREGGSVRVLGGILERVAVPEIVGIGELMYLEIDVWLCDHVAVILRRWRRRRRRELWDYHVVAACCSLELLIVVRQTGIGVHFGLVLEEIDRKNARFECFEWLS